MMVPNNDNGWRHTSNYQGVEHTVRVIGWEYEETDDDDPFIVPVVVGPGGYPFVPASGRTWHVEDRAVQR